MSKFTLPVSAEPIAIAVSGGPDSMALLHLAHHWAREKNISLHALTVDHGLRLESAHEAVQIAQWCGALKVPHTILRWQHAAITSGIQEKARRARYEMMFAWCRQHHIRHLLTAHHADDQLETFLLRLLRQSGIEGLACMQQQAQRHDITLHRPLLGWRKQDLLRYLHSHHHPYLNDPSNLNLLYSRSALRPIVNRLSEDHRQRLLAAIQSFATFRTGLEQTLARAMAQSASIEPQGYATLSTEGYAKQPAELRIRMLHHLCLNISGHGEPVRTEKLARLDRNLLKKNTAKKYTLGGVMFIAQAKEKRWLIMREPRRIEGRAAIGPHPLLWDGRFLVKTLAASNLAIGALGTPPRAFRKALERSGIPKAVWPTLPALFALEECVNIPHIDGCSVTLQFIAAKPLENRQFLAINA